MYLVLNYSFNIRYKINHSSCLYTLRLGGKLVSPQSRILGSRISLHLRHDPLSLVAEEFLLGVEPRDLTGAGASLLATRTHTSQTWLNLLRINGHSQSRPPSILPVWSSMCWACPRWDVWGLEVGCSRGFSSLAPGPRRKDRDCWRRSRLKRQEMRSGIAGEDEVGVCFIQDTDWDSDLIRINHLPEHQ